MTDVQDDAGPLTDADAVKGLTQRMMDFQEKEAREEKSDPPSQVPQTQDAEELEAEPEAEAHAEAEGDSETEAEAGSTEEEQPVTLEAIAQALELSPDDLGAQLEVSVKVNGKMVTVPLNDALAGFRMEKSYTQDTERLAADRRAHDEQVTQATALLTGRLQEADTLIETLETQLSTDALEERIGQLYAEGDSEQAGSLQFHLNKQQKALQQMKDAREKLRGQAAQEQQSRAVGYRGEQQRLLGEKLPDMLDPAKGQTIQTEVSDYLRGRLGFPDTEIANWFNGPFDHRHVVMANDAAQAWKAKKGIPKTLEKLKGKPKVKKGTTQERSASSKIDGLRARLKKTTGSAQDRTAARMLLEKGIIK